MVNPFSRMMDVVRDMSRTIGYETAGNFIYERLFGGTVPEDKSGGKSDKDKKEKESEGSELQTSWAAFSKKDEAALAQAMGTLAVTNGLAHAVMSDRISELGLFGVRALRAIIALNKDEEDRVRMLENWAQMDGQQWQVHLRSVGLDSVERFWAYLKRIWAEAKIWDQELAARIRERMEAVQSSQDPNQLFLPLSGMNENAPAQPIALEAMSEPPVEVPMSKTAKVWVAILIVLMAAFGFGPLLLGW